MMTNGERLFLVLAEELNFGRAAKKCFISQQSLSDHIKRLEEHYGMSLFTRRPTVALTEAGRAVQCSLLAVRNLEQGLDAERTRFILCGVSLMQVIFMTETGSLILKSKAPANIFTLILIFLERTIVGLIVMTLLSNLFY